MIGTFNRARRRAAKAAAEEKARLEAVEKAKLEGKDADKDTVDTADDERPRRHHGRR